MSFLRDQIRLGSPLAEQTTGAALGEAIVSIFAMSREVSQNLIMVKIERTAKKPARKPATPKLPEVRFENPRLAALGIEPMTLAELNSKVPGRRLGEAQRVDFFHLMLVTDGRGRHTVDFVEWPLAPGSLVFVRPGQVQQWHLDGDFSAQIVLIAPNVLPHRSALSLPRDLELLGLDEWRPCAALDADCSRLIESGLQQLRHDFDGFAGQDLDIALIRHQLMTLLLRIAKAQGQIAEAATAPRALKRKIYRLFVQALEADFQRQHGLQYYAGRLGYAASTISRACLAAEGRAAKQVIDRRIALEAQRLLVHSLASVAEIAHLLGFTESTNFVKFFRRTLGITPSEFRLTTMHPPPRPA